MVATAERTGAPRIPNPPPRPRKSPQPGRSADGRFAAGNPGGPGNPYTRKSAELRSLMCEALTDQDILDLTQALLFHAKQGNMAAARLLLLYVIGKPGEAKDPDRLDQDEWDILKERQNHSLKEMNDTLEGFPLSILLGMTKGLTQLLEDTLRDKFLALGQKPDEAMAGSKSNPTSAPMGLKKDTAEGKSALKSYPENAADQRPKECVKAPIEPGKVGAVGTTCRTRQAGNFEPNPDLHQELLKGDLPQDKAFAGFEIPASVQHNPRFQELLAKVQSLYTQLTEEGSPPSGAENSSKGSPVPQSKKTSRVTDQHLDRCVTAPIEPGEVGDVGTTCPSAQRPPGGGNNGRVCW